MKIILLYEKGKLFFYLLFLLYSKIIIFCNLNLSYLKNNSV
jgi:hypothetical protein